MKEQASIRRVLIDQINYSHTCTLGIWLISVVNMSDHLLDQCRYGPIIESVE